MAVAVAPEYRRWLRSRSRVDAQGFFFTLGPCAEHKNGSKQESGVDRIFGIFFGLTLTLTDSFFLVVQHERAGNPKDAQS